MTVTVTPLHGGRPWRAELDGPLFDAARRALAAAFGREPVITGEGGSIPVVGDFERILGAPVLLVGFGLPGENAHAPDEWMCVENFEKGMRAVACLWEELSPQRHSRVVEYSVAGLALDTPPEVRRRDLDSDATADSVLPRTRSGRVLSDRGPTGLLVARMPVPLLGTRYPLLVVVVLSEPPLPMTNAPN